MDAIDWDCYFMSFVYLVALKSKDQNTKIGAVIVGPDNETVGSGYNSFVRGLNDNISERQDSPEKYFYFEHAERNSIYNITRKGSSALKGCRIYTQGIPCADCARAIIQVGINEVIVHKLWNDENIGSKWIESAGRSMEMFNESNVKVRIYDGPIINELFGWRRSKKILLNNMED